MSESEWEDIAVGPAISSPMPTVAPTSGSSDDAWEDVAIGPPGERTWGDTLTNWGQSLARGGSGVVDFIENNNPFSPKYSQNLARSLLGDERIPGLSENVDAKRIETLGNPNYENASRAERYIGAGIEAAPYAVTGGGLAPAVMSGVGGEVARDLGAPPLVGALLGGMTPGVLAGGVSKAARAIGGDDFKQTAKSLEQQAIGAKYTDYVKSAKHEFIDPSVAVDDIETGLRKDLEKVISKGTFEGIDKSPQSLFKANYQQIVRGAKAQNEIISKADEVLGGPAIPESFPNAKAFVDRWVSPTDRPKMRKYLEEFGASLKQETDGSLKSLNEVKQALQKKVYAGSEAGKEVVDKYIQSDIREFLEKATDKLLGQKGALKEVNSDLGAHIGAESILRRGIGADEAANFANKAIQANRTSGGSLTGPTLRGAAIGASAGSAIGMAGPGGLIGGGLGYGFGKGLQYLSSPEGKFATASALRRTAPVRELAGEARRLSGAKVTLPSVGQSALIGRDQGGQRESSQSASKPVEYRQESKQSMQKQSGRALSNPSPNYRPNPAPTQSANFAKQDVANLVKSQPPLIQAMIKVESAGNKSAVSPKGARGLMQIMPANFKALGITDPEDPVQNIRGGIKLLNEELGRYKGDTRLALAAFNAGSPAVNKAIKRARSTDWLKVAQYLPAETRAYVPRILRYHEIPTRIYNSVARGGIDGVI